MVGNLDAYLVLVVILVGGFPYSPDSDSLTEYTNMLAERSQAYEVCQGS